MRALTLELGRTQDRTPWYNTLAPLVMRDQNASWICEYATWRLGSFFRNFSVTTAAVLWSKTRFKGMSCAALLTQTGKR
jgi:hypothetical protein